MSAPPKDRTPLAGGALQNTLDLGTEQQRKRTAGRPPLQRNSATGRNAGQKSPTWPELPGERALRLLAAFWGKS